MSTFILGNLQQQAFPIHNYKYKRMQHFLYFSALLINHKLHAMHKIILILCLLLSITGFAQKRVLSYTPSKLPIFINKSGDTLSKALIGGLNQPQFQAIDLNNDGKKDLIIHDRSGGVLLPYINTGNNDITTYDYQPNYIRAFPKIENAWFLLVDYDKDGREDLWTKINFQPVLYRNITKPGDKLVSFFKTAPKLMAYNFGQPPLDSNNISADNFNIPTIGDVDGDGDIDIFSYQANEGFLHLYRNMTVDFKLPLHPPVFDFADFCWGSFRDTSFDGLKNFPCNYKYYRKKHSGGSTLLWFDNDNDGDMDLLMGNAGGKNLIFLKNGKKEFGLSIDSIIGYDGHWPKGGTVVNLKSFPGAFMLDADGDGVKDILVAPNQVEKAYPVEETEQVWFYKNKGSNTYPDFQFNKRNYFTDEILDHGAYSDPILYDIDSDTDLDLILASNGDHAKTGDKNFRLIFYKNIGTTKIPVFKLENEDLWGLSNDSIQYLSVSFGDLNGDGLTDMLAGNYFGSLYFYKNIGSSSTWAFTNPIRNYHNIRVGERSTPQVVDLNADGLLDLVVGARGGNFNYFKNTGNKTDPQFIAVDDTLGNVIVNEIIGYDGTNPIYNWIGDATGEMADLDNDGKNELIFGGDEGKVRCFKFDTYNQLAYSEDTSILFDSAFMRYTTTDFGTQSRPAVGDLDGDGIKDLIVGNNRGGINFLKGDVEILGIAATKKQTEPIIYPNPTNGTMLTIQKRNRQAYTFMLVDLTGKVMITESSNAGTELHQFDVSKVSDGLYILQSEGADNSKYFTRVLVVKQK